MKKIFCLLIFFAMMNIYGEKSQITVNTTDSIPLTEIENFFGFKIDIFTKKFEKYDSDFQKMQNAVLFTESPSLEVEEPFQIYNFIDDINLGGQIADIFFLSKRKFSDNCTRLQNEYKNLYIYYYCMNNEIEKPLFVIGISRHTGEIVFVYGDKYYQWFEGMSFELK
ncbi:MAG: hypothetical protein II973_04385 [Spirochaetaceae bacterium]|nr:hypothetical protein [Spirochaetaceae bacterium]